ncbi:MAG TPA: response regulator, partial [Isosphaeraceae bacterium]|nr:response regulator [Isosphaeraceae bacterium]
PASSLAEARKAIEEGPVDVVVSDIGLPDGSGLELLHPIRDQIRRGAIALSGFGTDTDRLRSREAGFDIHLTKPIDFARLQAAIAKVVQTDGTRPDASYFAV